ncbi:MAG: hypothetical protein IPI67_25515 [Myxococcales bacterium]|nr:hypothetical protein [Myxococcales bacterium]
MANRRSVWLFVTLVGAVAPALSVITVADDALAAPAARYRVGMRVKAKRTCTVQGYEVKKGVILSVAAVQSDDKGKVTTLDLNFSGMTIGNVPAQVVDSLFSAA